MLVKAREPSERLEEIRIKAEEVGKIIMQAAGVLGHARVKRVQFIIDKLKDAQ